MFSFLVLSLQLTRLGLAVRLELQVEILSVRSVDRATMDTSVGPALGIIDD